MFGLSTEEEFKANKTYTGHLHFYAANGQIYINGPASALGRKALVNEKITLSVDRELGQMAVFINGVKQGSPVNYPLLNEYDRKFLFSVCLYTLNDSVEIVNNE